jgi:hypothetical protein
MLLFAAMLTTCQPRNLRSAWTNCSSWSARRGISLPHRCLTTPPVRSVRHCNVSTSIGDYAAPLTRSGPFDASLAQGAISLNSWGMALAKTVCALTYRPSPASCLVSQSWQWCETQS